MAMHFNVTIAYAIELPEDHEDFEQYTGDGLDIITEGEAGDRAFLGDILSYYDVDHAISGELRLNVKPEVKEKLTMIAEQHGLNKPDFWAIGAVS